MKQSLQLYVKAMLIEFFGLRTRIHGIINNLSLLFKCLMDSGFEHYASELMDFIRRNRGVLDLMDMAYIEARYGLLEYTYNDATNCIEIGIDCIKLLERIRSGLKGGRK